eukprot:TRINITY_DN4407_c0_g1_i1.p1 TRINITY_DN4407_c0_g1~~TRINITY_DN4407_c0_g1_i1.p1  ORF type:complete len:326 (+),score=132.05 TRINITY_DN4407_c0_g1_i1:64-1041(+)
MLEQIANIDWEMYLAKVLDYPPGIQLAMGAAVVAVSLGIYDVVGSFLRQRREFNQSRASLGAIKDKGEWALITGASSGLGREFAFRFARLGVPCILVARRKDLLEQLASTLNTLYSVETLVVEADISSPQGALELVEALKEYKIGVLVNNAGAGYAGDFVDQDLDRQIQITELNCVTPLILFRSYLPGMISRDRGFVINVSSVSAYLPLPTHAIYAATKAYLSFLSLAVNEELKHRSKKTNVKVITCEPGTVDDTGFQTAANQLIHRGHKSSEVVSDCVDSLFRGDRSTVCGSFVWARTVIASVLPRRLGLRLAWNAMSKYSSKS